MTVYVDTSGIYATANRSDDNHERARDRWRDLLSSPEVLVTTNYVITETLALLQRRLGMHAARDFLQSVAPLLLIVWVDETIHDRAVAALLNANERRLSLVDCVSFEVMRTRGIDVAFALDAHFSQRGFDVVP